MKNEYFMCRCEKMFQTKAATIIDDWLLCPSCANEEWTKQPPKIGKSGIKLYPAVIQNHRIWVTIPEEEDFE